MAPEPTPVLELVCDARGLPPDVVTVDALARLQLAARRQRCRVVLCNASQELLDLVAFMGLEEVLGVDGRGFSLARLPSNQEGRG